MHEPSQPEASIRISGKHMQLSGSNRLRIEDVQHSLCSFFFGTANTHACWHVYAVASTACVYTQMHTSYSAWRAPAMADCILINGPSVISCAMNRSIHHEILRVMITCCMSCCTPNLLPAFRQHEQNTSSSRNLPSMPLLKNFS